MDNLLNTILQMLEGSEITLEIFFVTLVIALPLGMMAALGRLSKWRPLSTLFDVLLAFGAMRLAGLFTRSRVRLLFVYFALPMIGIRLPDIAAALLAFTLNYAAYFAEIFRAGIQSVPKGQYEAARTLGMNYTQTMRRIILPQVIRIVLPPVSNETINLVKDTSLIYILAMNDLLRVARTIVQREFDMTPFLIASRRLTRAPSRSRASSWPTRMRTAWQSTPTSRRRGRSSRTRAWSSSSSTSSRI